MKKIVILFCIFPFLLIFCTQNPMQPPQEFIVSEPVSTRSGLASLENMVPNGEYVISVFSGNGWAPAGTLGYDKFYRELTLDMGDRIPEDDHVTIRIAESDVFSFTTR